jgi:divalent cation transporter
MRHRTLLHPAGSRELREIAQVRSHVITVGFATTVTPLIVESGQRVQQTLKGARGQAADGGLLPWLFDAFALDPAFGSGPLATVVQDLLSIWIYLSITTFVMS